MTKTPNRAKAQEGEVYTVPLDDGVDGSVVVASVGNGGILLGYFFVQSSDPSTPSSNGTV